MTEHHVDIEVLSAYFDGELPAARRSAVAAHLARCPACAARLVELAGLAADFRALPAPDLGFDLATALEAHLPRQTPAPAAPRRGWGWLPLSLGASASLACGIALGFALLGGAATSRPATAMRVFDTFPPGSLCAGTRECFAKGVLE